MASGEAVANEPRLFVGQLPAECTEEDLWPVFSPYGTVRNLHILKGPDSKPRGCAMVLYARWAQAEAAAEALDGAAALATGQGRPLVVHFANPRKPPPGQPPEPGLAPKKLFIGQVPRDATEEMLRPYFEPHGEIERINILRTQRGQSAGCGFVQYRKWAQAEAAMEYHNGKTRIGNSEVPLVVKFADAKRREQAVPTLVTQVRTGTWPADPKLLPDPADYSYQLGRRQWPGLLAQASPAQAQLLSSQLGLQQQMQSLMAQSYPGGFPPGPAQYVLPDPALLQQPASFQPPDRFSEPRLKEGSLPAANVSSTSANLSASQIEMENPSDPLTSQLLSSNLNSSMSLSQGSLPHQGSRLLPGSCSGRALSGGSGSVASLPAVSAAELAAHLNLAAVSLSNQPTGSEGSAATPFAQPQQQQPAEKRGVPDFGNAPSLSQQVGLPSLAGLQYRPDLQNQAYVQSLAALPPLAAAGPYAGAQFSGLPPRAAGAEAGGWPWGQRIGSNDKHNEWKLFIGQVPLEASEEELWSMFSPIGHVLELYVLRNNSGKSRGCAFVTYLSKSLADQAVSQLNGTLMPNGKTLVVKFADRASSSRAAPPPAPPSLLNLYMP